MTGRGTAKDSERIKVISQTTEAFADSFFDIAEKYAPPMSTMEALFAVMNGAAHAMVHTLHTLEAAGKIENGLEWVKGIGDNMVTAWEAHEALRLNDEATIQ